VLRLFKEIDVDRDGLVKFKEFENYYNFDYEKKMADIEREKEKVNVQYEIFDHMIKVLS
jgi:hypothetical protein